MPSVVFTFGRMNPPTRGHEILVNKVLETAKKFSCDHEIVVSTSHDSVRNPLSPEKKLSYLLEYFPNVNITPATKEYPSIFHNIKRLNADYDKLYIVCGFDRIKEYEKFIQKYNGIEYDYKHIEIIESGNLETRETFSGTLVRNLISSDKIKNLLNRLCELYSGDEKEIIEFMENQTKDNSLMMILNSFIKNKDPLIKYYLLLDLHYVINNSKKVLSKA